MATRWLLLLAVRWCSEPHGVVEQKSLVPTESVIIRVSKRSKLKSVWKSPKVYQQRISTNKKHIEYQQKTETTFSFSVFYQQKTLCQKTLKRERASCATTILLQDLTPRLLGWEKRSLLHPSFEPAGWFEPVEISEKFWATNEKRMKMIILLSLPVVIVVHVKKHQW